MELDKRLNEWTTWYKEHSHYLAKPGADLEQSNKFLMRAFLGTLELLALCSEELKKQGNLTRKN